MKSFRPVYTGAAGLLAGVCLLALAPAGHAQEAEEPPAGESAQEDETIIVTGTRRASRTAAESIAPIDIVGGDVFTQSAQTDIQNLLRQQIPSFNVNTQPISDAATITRPANLRGLSPDNTLVLLNGKRRHRGAVISFLGGGISDGSQGVDISTLPSIGLERVEVLRDGASSQYGSDAVAGVMNFVLRDDAEGGSLTARVGEAYAGDGEFFQVAGNVGLRVHDEGFLNLSLEFREQGDTSRSVQRSDAAALIAAGNTAVADPAQVWGQPEVRDDVKAFANFGLPVHEFAEVYAFGNVASRETEGGFFFRNPTSRAGVFTGPLVDPVTGAADPGGVPSILVGDLSGDTAGDCPAGIPLQNGVNSLPDPTVLGVVQARDDCFSFVELFPGGFTPRFGGQVDDTAGTLGLRGELPFGAGVSYDVSFQHGRNEVSYFIFNTINASLGPDTPTEFNPGGYIQRERLFNADFSYPLETGLFASPLNIAVGYERRNERFEIVAGDPASFALGELADPDAFPAFPSGQGFSTSSNGFPGFSTAIAGAAERVSNSIYLDLETDVTDRLTVQGAVRFEDYDGFDETTNFKVGALYEVTEALRLRGTFSTGFRVPTVGQETVVNVTTQFDSQGNLADQGTVPLNSAVGQLAADFVSAPVSEGGLGLSRPTLGPEEAENFSLGFAFDAFGFTATVDYFNIKLGDRIANSSEIEFADALAFIAGQNGVTLTTSTPRAQIDELDDAGVLNEEAFEDFADLTQFLFFTNAFDTETEGVDVVVTGPLDFVPVGQTDLTFAYNWTSTEVTRIETGTGGTALVSDTRIRQLEEQLPNHRFVSTLTHAQGPWRGLARLSYFGEFFSDDPDPDQVLGSQVLVDVQLDYQFRNGLTFTVGADNVFDSFPDENNAATNIGNRFPEDAPAGFNGGTYYVGLRYDW